MCVCVHVQTRQYVKITDFGWAAHEQTTLGRSQSFAGTASGSYMAPEVRRRQHKARGQGLSYDGNKADIWSCGVVLCLLRSP
jgi:serine/threonine protein kinase